jgi:hypothetical protein
VNWVLVNGEPAVKNGSLTGTCNGEVIKRKASLFEF